MHFDSINILIKKNKNQLNNWLLYADIAQW